MNKIEVIDAIEAAFCAGRDAPENAVCPYQPETLNAHWWTRGFAYTARLNRALIAERRINCFDSWRPT